MKNNLFTKEINLLDKQIQSFSEERNKYIMKKHLAINELLKTIDSNNSQIYIYKKKLDSDKKSLASLNQTREVKLKSLQSDIDSLQNQINLLQNNNFSNYSNDFELLSKEISSLTKQKKSYEKKVKYNKRKIYQFEERQNEENERNNMLKEEYYSCKKLLVMLTSKIESHSEFIKNLCKSRDALTSSLEKLSEIDPDNNEFSNNVIEMNKLAENIYSYCNEYLEFNTTYDDFIDKVKNQDDIDKVIDYLQEISKYKLPKNLFEYALIALCRIMTYEKILDLRMNFINSIDEKDKNKNKGLNDIDNTNENGIINNNITTSNNDGASSGNKNLDKNNDDKYEKEKEKEKNNSEDKNEINKFLLYKKEYEINQLKLEECKRNLTNKEKTYNKINNDKLENIDNIKKMNYDLILMNKYRTKLLDKINKNEKDIMNRQKEYLQLINNLNEEIILCKEKIVKKNLKLSENSKKYEDKINELINIRNSIINSNNSYKNNEITDNMILLTQINNKINKISENRKDICDNENNINVLNSKDSKKNEINSGINLKKLIQSNESAKSQEKDKDNDNDNEYINKIFSNIPMNIPEEDFICLQNIKPLFKGVTVQKRQIIHVKQKIYENYKPVINNKSTFPKDYYFKQYFLFLDKNLDKLHFQKLSTSDRSIGVSPSSILRLEIPIFTKNLIFLQKIYSNLNKKLNLDSTKKINEYFLKEKNTIIRLYLDNFCKNNNHKEINFDEINKCDAIDENIFNEKYREALLLNKQYMINIYLKPDEDTKIEILFQTRNDFKNWINGLDELVSNYTKIKQFINKEANNALKDSCIEQK